MARSNRWSSTWNRPSIERFIEQAQKLEASEDFSALQVLAEQVFLRRENEFYSPLITHYETQIFRSQGEADAFAREQAERYQHRPEVELYDLQNDPYELKNLAAQPEQKPNLARLRAALDAWIQEQGDEGVQTQMETKAHQGSELMQR